VAYILSISPRVFMVYYDTADKAKIPPYSILLLGIYGQRTYATWSGDSSNILMFFIEL
jgi:hypothetical protein